MNILEFDKDNEAGFAWILVEAGTSSKDEKWTVQCCLENQGEGNAIDKIIMSDCGADWGLCAEANQSAFDYYGQNRCLKALFQTAKENGLEVV